MSFAALGELAEAFSPEGWRETVRRIAVLAMLCSLLLPARELWQDRESILRTGEAFFSKEASGGGEEAWAGLSELLFRYAEQRGFSSEGMKVVLSVEGEALSGMRLILPRCPYSERAAMEEELEEAFGVPVEVLTKEGERA